MSGRLCCNKPDDGWIKNETIIAPPSLVKMKHVELFTQHRFKANIGRLLKHRGVITLISTASPYHIESQGEPTRP
ncbi:hypothetical protein C1882_27275 [Pseudomonas sp. FW305-E2]|nr:hypothetical protein C1882_27275 [Pseudomonas sp. FW305-E2]